MSKHKYAILLIFFLILMRIPALMMWGPNITGSDSSMYMETARNVAEGKGYVSSVCRFNMDIDTLSEYIQENGNRYVGMTRAPVYVYSMSFIYLLTGKAHFMLGVNILNLLLLFGSLLFLYRFMFKKFPSQKIAHLAALLWVGGSFTLFNYSFGAWLESFTLFNFVLVFVLHSDLINQDRSKWWKYLLYAVALASLFTIKRSAMPIAAAFILHLALQRNYKRFVLISFIFAGFVLGWYALRYYVMQIPPLYPFSHNFPYSGYSREVSAIPHFFISGKAIIDVLKKFLSTAMSMKNLGLLFPFALLYLVGHKNDKEKQVIWVLLLLNIAIYCFSRGNPSPRYIFPIFVPLMMYSALLLDKTLKHLFAGKRLIPAYVFLMCTLFYQLTYVAGYSLRVPQSARDREIVFQTADDLLDKYEVSDDAIVVFNVRGYNVYSDRGFILTPPNTTHDNYQELIDTYDVDYILHCNGLTQHFSWFERTIGIEMFGGLELLEEIYLENLMSVELYSTKQEDSAVIQSSGRNIPWLDI